MTPSDRDSVVNLWIGRNGHVVHYPIRAGTAVNIVAVTSNRWRSPAWSTAASREEGSTVFLKPYGRRRCDNSSRRRGAGRNGHCMTARRYGPGGAAR